MHRALAGAAAILLLSVAPLAASPRFEITAGFTTASSDGPQTSGASFGLSALWNLGRRVSFGPMLFADDLGTKLGNVTDSTGADLGPTVDEHRLAYGVAWRADVALPLAGAWSAAAGATWGLYRIQDDRLGDVSHVEGAVGWSFSAAVLRPLRPSTTFGLSARWHKLKSDLQSHYLRVGVDLTWQPGAGAPAPSTSKPAHP